MKMQTTAPQNASFHKTKHLAKKPVSGVDTGILLEAGTNELEILVFNVGKERCGVNVAKVREARTIERAVFLPRFPDAIDGVVRVREAVVPAVDLCRYLWGTKGDFDPAQERNLLLEFNERMVAFRVQSIDRVYSVSWKDIIPMPQCSDGDVPITGLVLLDGKIVTMLDFESIGAKLGVSGSVECNVGEKTESESEVKNLPLIFADDSPLIRRMMQNAFVKSGYSNIRFFSDGQEAWDYLAHLAANTAADEIRQAAAGVITDIEMPRMDGFSLTKRIREHAVLKDLPVILFSSLVSKDNEKKGMQVGATAQISKPRWDELADALLEVLERVV
jgi:two-component system, chemotaxis family, chemotaxis protein CheV